MRRLERPGARPRAVRRRGATSRARKALYAGAGGHDARELAFAGRCRGSPRARARGRRRRGRARRADRARARRRASSFVDLSPRMVELARGTRSSTHRSATCRRCRSPTRSFDYRRRGVDALPRRRISTAALAELARVLAPGRRARRRHELGRRTSGGAARARRLTAAGATSCRSSRENGASILAPHLLATSSASTPTVGCSIPDERRRCSARTCDSMSRFAADRGARRHRAAVRRARASRRSSSRRNDPPGRADPAQARRRGAARRRARRADPRLRARRGARLPDGRVLHGRLLPRAVAARDVRADRRDDPERRDDRPRRGARAQGRRQALDRRRRRQDVAGGRRRSSPRAACRSGR